MSQRPIDVMAYRRAQESTIEANRVRIANINKVTSRANWENTTHMKIQQKTAQNNAAAMEATAQQELHQRRVQLANIYNSEMQAWQDEISSSVETAEDRKASLKKRANALKAARLEQDQRFVAEMRGAQWRDSCDELRALDTQATLLDVADKRREQLGDRELQQAQLLEEDEQWSAAWDADRMKKEKRETDDMTKLKTQNEEMRQDLDLQRLQRHRRIQRATSDQQNEAEDTKSRWHQEKMLQETHDTQCKEAERQRGKAVLRYNNIRQSKRSEDAKMEMESDLLLLKVALEKERRELESEEEKKRAEAAITKQYQEHLRLQMIKEKEDDSLLEELRRQDEERVQAKRDAQFAREQECRQELLNAVMEGREQQLVNKARTRQVEAAEDHEHAVRTKTECERLVVLEASTQAAQAKARADNQGAIRVQKNAKETAKEQQLQHEYLEWKTMKYAEKKFQDVLGRDGGKVARGANVKPPL
jgi:hypothetical protein